jgi:hypothetical protein
VLSTSPHCLLKKSLERHCFCLFLIIGIYWAIHSKGYCLGISKHGYNVLSPHSPPLLLSFILAAPFPLSHCFLPLWLSPSRQGWTCLNF